jgi:hypothetical protein
LFIKEKEMENFHKKLQVDQLFKGKC